MSDTFPLDASSNRCHTLPCPLCEASGSTIFHQDRYRSYQQCLACQLVFVPTRYHLESDREKAQYDLHRNAVGDPGYRRFLSRLTDPLLAYLQPGSQGLDFGCGPAPALADIMSQAGFPMALYDIYYACDSAVLERRFDFITATEVIEHLARPAVQLPRLWSLLRPGGYLGLMTKLVINRERFATWHYIRDPTHIAFYSRPTLDWLAQQLGAQLCLLRGDVVIFQRPPAGQ